MNLQMPAKLQYANPNVYISFTHPPARGDQALCPHHKGIQF